MRWIGFIIGLFCSLSAVFSQQTDTLSLKKFFFVAQDIEDVYPDSSEKIYQMILKFGEEKLNRRYVAGSYYGLAIHAYQRRTDFRTAIAYHFKAVKIFEAAGDSSNMMNVYNAISSILSDQLRYEEALRYLKTSISYSRRHKNNNILFSSVTLSADCYHGLKKTDSAIVQLRSLADNPPPDTDSSQLGVLFNTLGNTYFNLTEETDNLKHLNYAIEYANKGKAILSKLPYDELYLGYSLGLLGASYMKLGNYSDAEKNYLEAIEIYSRLGNYKDLVLIYNEMTQLYIRKGDSEKALSFFNKHEEVFKKVYNEENSASLSQMKTQFETEKKEAENSLLKTKNELSDKTIKEQRITAYFIITGLGLALLLAFFIFRGLKQQRNANTIITSQKLEVEQQKHLLEEQKKEILDSIRYAKRIQKAHLPTEKYISKHLKS